MTISARPLDYANINSWSALAQLELTQGNGGTYYVQLLNGANRYVPQAGSTVQVVFPRALTVAPSPSNQDVTATCVVADTRDASIYSFTLSPASVDKITTGGAKLVLVEGGTTKTYPLDHFVTRRSSAPGA